MASFITTMSVPESPSLATRVSPSKPLEPVFTPTEPSSCIRRPSSSSIHSLHEAASGMPPPSRLGEENSPGQLRPISLVKQFLYKAFYGDWQSPTPSRSFESENNYGAHGAPLLHRSNTVDSFVSSNSRTRAGAPFKPKNASRGTTSWQLKQFAEATLGSGSLRKAVKLPEGEDENEWLAVNGTSHCSHLATLEIRANSCTRSRRFLQPDQFALWQHHRVLLTTELSRNESN